MSVNRDRGQFKLTELAEMREQRRELTVELDEERRLSEIFVHVLLYAISERLAQLGHSPCPRRLHLQPINLLETRYLESSH